MSDVHPLDYFPDEETGDELVDSLALIDKARAALAQAENLTDIGHVREVAERARRYASAAKLGRAAENHAAKLRLDAERKAGALLAESPKNPGVRVAGGVMVPPPANVPRLADLGVSKQQAKDWQRIARVPDDVFDAYVDEVQKRGEPLTTSGVVQIARTIEKGRRAAEPKPVVQPETIPARIEVGAAAMMRQPDETVHLIVTSPPYAVGIDYAGGDVQPAAWPDFMFRWMQDALRVTIPHGRLAVNVPLDTTQGGYRPTYAQAVEAALRAGWTYRTTIVWLDDHTNKSTARGSIDSASAPHIIAGVEMIGLFSKGPWMRHARTLSDLGRDEWLSWTNGVWRFPGETRPWEDHPAAFPLELPRRLIKLLSFPGDIVLDPFVGSGTTALAALQLGRQAIGFDRSQEYVDSTLRRLAAHRERSGAPHDARAGTGLPESGAGADEPGGLRSRVHRGVSGAEEHELVPSGRTGAGL